MRIDKFRRDAASEQKLTLEDIDALYALLDKRPESITQEDWFVIANDIMGEIIAKGYGEGRITRKFHQIITDDSRHSGLRSPVPLPVASAREAGGTLRKEGNK